MAKHNRSRYCSVTYSSLLFAMMLLLPAMVFAQVSRYLQQGNKLYDQQKYDEATANYTKALQKNPNDTAGLFNLGSSLYQQKHYDSSRKLMAATAGAMKDKRGKAAANYNIGNTYMAQKKWEEAVDAYKQTLRNNPQDVDAKYNLSYAEEMLKKQNGGKNDKDKKDQKKDKKDQKDKDKKDDKGQGKNDPKDPKDNKDKQPQEQPSKLTKQQAENMLNALQNQEKKLQDKMKKEKGIPVKLDKDW